MQKHRKTKKNHFQTLSTCPDATFYGLHHWMKHLFEELGWMVLAHKRGMLDKVSTYKHSIERCKCAIEEKMKNIHDHDKKEDLRIMLENIEILWEHVGNDF
jgi:hypothetical protein